MDVREFIQQFHHAVIILECMHAHPGQTVLAGHQVLVEGLMHMPQKYEADFSHELILNGRARLDHIACEFSEGTSFARYSRTACSAAPCSRLWSSCGTLAASWSWLCATAPPSLALPKSSS